MNVRRFKTVILSIGFLGSISVLPVFANAQEPNTSPDPSVKTVLRSGFSNQNEVDAQIAEDLKGNGEDQEKVAVADEDLPVQHESNYLSEDARKKLAERSKAEGKALSSSASKRGTKNSESEASPSKKKLSNEIPIVLKTSKDVIQESSELSGSSEPTQSERIVQPKITAKKERSVEPAYESNPTEFEALPSKEKTLEKKTTPSDSFDHMVNSEGNAEILPSQQQTEMQAQTNSVSNDLEVVEFVLTKNVAGREPAEIVENYIADDGKAYAFARLNVSHAKQVTFVWSRDGHVHNRFTTTVHPAKKFRTYSATRIRPGNWTVQLVDGDQILSEKTFTVE